VQLYEIRILRADGNTSLIYPCTHLSDRAAIAMALELARGAPYEVWRDLACLRGNPAPVGPTYQTAA
jgi:hypothetical protein